MEQIDDVILPLFDGDAEERIARLRELGDCEVDPFQPWITCSSRTTRWRPAVMC
ncbi:hypothetical protein UMZ34_17630 [Halopseudomonas pachastrellae]|nr:hypothetical protein UMZ34_17630 [Halopseudomonas pachastrellae]